MKSKYTRSLVWLGVLVVAALGLWFTRDLGTDGMTGRSRSATTSNSNLPVGFTQEDVDAEFERLNEELKNAFYPVVARAGSGFGGKLAPNEIPASYTGGEAGWFYTGSFYVDGVPLAVLENLATDEGLYLYLGEKVKEATITKIAPEYIEIRGIGGQVMRLDLMGGSGESDDLFEGAIIEPVRPDVAGFLGTDELNGVNFELESGSDRIEDTNEN